MNFIDGKDIKLKHFFSHVWKEDDILQKIAAQSEILKEANEWIKERNINILNLQHKCDYESSFPYNQIILFYQDMNSGDDGAVSKNELLDLEEG